MRRTKIVCTLGLATKSLNHVRDLIRAGMDVARLNFSHGTLDQHARFVQWVRQAGEELDRPIAILQDLAGPKIRTGMLRGHHPVHLQQGQKLKLTAANVDGSSRRISISYDGLARDVKKGYTVLLDDGLIELRVLGASGQEVETEVVQGGLLKEHKGVNLPAVGLHVQALTPKDETDLLAGIKLGVDYVALSFVRKAVDVRRIKSLISQAKAHIPVLAKLEKPEAIDNLNAILKTSDGVMVARGDLGVEMSPEKVPLIQKKIIHQAATARIPVITATQMLESMTIHLRPTRAEASDVANAIFDGTDAVMLSAETASGRHPVEAVQMMARIAEQVDQTPKEFILRRRRQRLDIAETVCESVVHAAQMLNVKAIVVFTRSGSTARLISKYRPACPVYAFCHDIGVARRAMLYWGVVPFVLPLLSEADDTLAQAEIELRRRRLVSKRDILAVVAGSPGRPGQTNVMKLIRAGAQ